MAEALSNLLDSRTAFVRELPVRTSQMVRSHGNLQKLFVLLHDIVDRAGRHSLAGVAAAFINRA